MPIISVSLSKKMLEELEKIRQDLGFSGRSEVLRAGARMLIEDNREKEKLSGKINVVLILMHNEEEESAVSEIKHRFKNVVKTQVHTHLKGKKCLETFILEGEAEKIKAMADLFRAKGQMDYVKLIVA